MDGRRNGELQSRLHVSKKTLFDFDFKTGPSILSFRKELFEAAISRLTKAVILNKVEIDKFRGIADEVEKLVKLKNLEDQDFEDAPEEFKVRLRF